MKSTKLVLETITVGKKEPHCRMYAPFCGACGEAAKVRSTQKGLIASVVSYVNIYLQCDDCGLKWEIGAYGTKKNIRNQKKENGA